MKALHYFQTLLPIAVGLSFWIFERKLGIHNASRLLFLIAQFSLIYICDLASISGLLIIGAMLGGYVTVLVRYPNYRILSIVFFAAFLVCWIVQKYLIPLGVLKWPIWPWLPEGKAHPLMIVGMSYMGFKLIHFFVDHRAGRIRELHPLEFLNWLFFFPSIVAGPMQRFEDWQLQRANSKFSVDDVVTGLQRLLIGMFMKFVMADTIHNASISQMSTGTLATASILELAGSAACYTLYLYWDFAGYSHMAIGLAKFWGITLPENFRSPFIARNLAEFWNRWHITLSLMLRDYIFYPLSLYLRRLNFSRRHPDLATVIPPIVTFLLVGIWHGPTLGFILYGLTQGIGLAFLAVVKRRKTKTALSRWWSESALGYVVGVLFNFAYVTLSFVFFGLSDEKLLILRDRIF